MKKVSIICFFSFIVLFVIGFAVGKWNYPNKRPQPQDNQDANIGLNLAVESAQSATTCDTIYVIQKYHQDTGTTSTDIQPIPAKYIDHTRAEIVAFLAEYETNPTLQDKKDGFTSISLQSFSPDKIVVLKTYEALSKENGYYLIAVNHKICVYYEDRKRIYYQTELSLDDFPDNVQQELIHGKHLDTEAEVYAFLESYTS